MDFSTPEAVDSAQLTEIYLDLLPEHRRESAYRPIVSKYHLGYLLRGLDTEYEYNLGSVFYGSENPVKEFLGQNNDAELEAGMTASIHLKRLERQRIDYNVNRQNAFIPFGPTDIAPLLDNIHALLQVGSRPLPLNIHRQAILSKIEALEPTVLKQAKNGNIFIFRGGEYPMNISVGSINEEMIGKANPPELLKAIIEGFDAIHFAIESITESKNPMTVARNWHLFKFADLVYLRLCLNYTYLEQFFK